jgi:pilus assembly protein CpaE
LRPISAALVVERQAFRTQVLEELKAAPVRIVLDQGAFGAWQVVQEKLQRLAPDVVVVDLSDQTEDRFECIRRLRTLSQPPAVVVIHDSDEAAVILKAMRAGATEFLTVPLEAGSLQTALDRIAALLPGREVHSESGGQVLAFLSVKGGAGATTLACGTAAVLGKGASREVLLADLDVETGNVAFAMKANSHYSILDACRSISRLDAHYWKGIISNGLPGLHILTAPADPRAIETPQGVEVRQVLNFARTLYPFSVIDLPSHLGPLTLAALEDADRAFLITTTELPSLHLAKRTLQMLSFQGYPQQRLALVLNRATRRDEVTTEDIERNLGVPVFWRFPFDAEGVNEFYVKGGTIGPKSDLGRSIRQFTEKISGAPAPAEKTKKSFLGI